MILRKQIESDNAKLEEARLIYSQYLRDYEDVKFPIENAQKETLDRFRAAINDYSESKATCRCGRAYYDDAWFTADGITMRIDADHPNDIRDRDWTWEEVEQVLSA